MCVGEIEGERERERGMQKESIQGIHTRSFWAAVALAFALAVARTVAEGMHATHMRHTCHACIEHTAGLIYVYMYIYMYIYIYICICIYMYMHTTHMRHAYHACIEHTAGLHMYTHKHTHTHTHKYIYIYKYIHIHIYIHDTSEHLCFEPGVSLL